MEKKDEVHYTDTNICSYIRHLHHGEKFKNDNVEHFHDDLEFTICLKGQYEVEFNGKLFTVKEGDGVFINSLVKHKVTTRNSEVIYVKCHPILLKTNDYIWRTFVAPLNKDASFTGVILHSSIPWQKRIIDLIMEMNQYKEDNNDSAALFMQTSLLEIWKLFYENYFDKNKLKKENSQLDLVDQMVNYIHSHYQKDITVNDIAHAVNVSLSSCNHLFKQYMHISPNAYLIDYRLRNGKQLLEETYKNVTEIADLTGFHTASYFSESFKKQYQITPKEYRESIKK